MYSSTAIARSPRSPIAANSNKAHRGSSESMVVRLSSLDSMLELAGEVIIVSSNLNAIGREIQEGKTISRTLSQNVKDLAITSSRISSDLHNLVTEVRTVGMGDLFARFKRLARDTARRLGKAIRFEVEGEDVCIDKKTSEKIYDPIAHQIRNSIAHGIEDKQTRIKLGKDPVGTVAVRVRNTENNTVIDVVDDGAGIDTDAVRRKALEMHLADEKTLAAMTDQALFEFLYLPGFSTAKYTSTTAGRGVGLDVVRSVMNELNGETRITSESGRGTTFTFILPKVTAVNIADALLVEAGSMTFAFPISSVVATQSVALKNVTTTTGKGRSIVYLGHILPLFDLLEVFGEPALAIEGDTVPVMIIEHKGRRAAYIVSDFLNPQKIVISEFSGTMQVPGLLGTAILSGRKMALVIEPAGLFEQTFGRQSEIDRQGSIHRLVTAAKSCQINPNENTPSEQNLDEISSEEIELQSPQNHNADAFESETTDQPDSEFLREVEIMLNQLNHDLLALEEKRDTETADAIFRQVHSIKGNLTMYGAEEPASVAHQLESILEQARTGALKLDDRVFDVLFDGCAYLEEVVKSMLNGLKPFAVSDKLLTGLKEFCTDYADRSNRPELIDLDDAQVVLDATGEFYLSSRRREGATLYQCRIEFDSADQPNFLVAYLILRQIQRIADVLGTYPAMTDIEAGICDTGLVVLFAPRTHDAELVTKLGERLKRYYGVKRFDTTTYA